MAILTLVGADFALDDRLVLHVLDLLRLLGPLHFGHVPVSDEHVQVLQACVRQHEREREQQDDSPGLGRGEEHVHRAKLFRLLQPGRLENVDQEVEANATPDEEYDDPIDQVG